MDPYRGEVWARIPQGCARDVDRAVAVASLALREGPWATLSASSRGKLMLRLADLIAANAQRLAEIEVRDNGKLLSEMLGQVNYNPEWWRYFGGLADKIQGAVVPIDKPNHFAFTRHEPVGVVAQITPWNAPLMLATWKLGPALAAGNCVIVKPPEWAPLTSSLLADCAHAAGLPPGVFNIVQGGGASTGARLVSDPRLARISFTGSVPTAKWIAQSAGANLVPCSLE
eukprot:gene47312-biopygen8639